MTKAFLNSTKWKLHGSISEPKGMRDPTYSLTTMTGHAIAELLRGGREGGWQNYRRLGACLHVKIEISYSWLRQGDF
jgi:hypothetical protein